MSEFYWGRKLNSTNRRGRWKPKGKPEERAYAIGDVHGCLSEMKQLLQRIKAHNDYHDSVRTHIIFLGDLIDRGPDSKGVIEFLMKFPFKFAKPLFIKGNHEEMMVRGLMGEPNLLPDWLEYGGYACAESYGVPQSELRGHDPDILEYKLRSAIPKKHVDFLDSFLDYVQFGEFLFTHAGIQPGIPIENQSGRELRWIRKPFLEHRGDLGVMVVHGHTISDEIEVKNNRIGLDTGAYETGILSAMCVEESNVSFLDNREKRLSV